MSRPTIEQVFTPVNKVLPRRPIPDGFLYPVEWIPGAAQGNALFNAAESEAGLPLTDEEYNELLNKYGMMRRWPQDVALHMGEIEVKKQPKWVPGEDKTPKRDMTPSSSVIKSVKITPENLIQVEFGKTGKKYTYQGGATVQEAAREVMKLLSSSSLGREINSKIPGSWGSTHALPF